MTQPPAPDATGLLTLCGGILDAACRLEARLCAEPTAAVAARRPTVLRSGAVSIPTKRVARAAAASVP